MGEHSVVGERGRREAEPLCSDPLHEKELPRSRWSLPPELLLLELRDQLSLHPELNFVASLAPLEGRLPQERLAATV